MNAENSNRTREREEARRRDEQREERAIDLLADAAHEDLPPPMSAQMISGVVRKASMEAAARRTRTNRYLAWAPAAAAVVLLGVAGALYARGVQQPEPEQVLTRMELPTGDRITSTEGARFHLQSTRPALRSVFLRDGTVLFDVRPLAGDEKFWVTTPHLKAHVRGTIFSVTVSGGRSRVHVFEGKVWVRSDERERMLGAEDTLDSGATKRSRASKPWESPLAEEGRFLAARRARTARTVNDSSRAKSDPGKVHAAPPGSRASPENPGHDGSRAEDSGSSAEASVARLPTLAQARQWLIAGRIDDVVRAARAVRKTQSVRKARARRGPWLLLEGDAERARGNLVAAAEAYERAIPVFTPTQATQAGLLAARVRFEQGKYTKAVAALDDSAADASGSPVEERALALRVKILLKHNRSDLARHSASIYLARFPNGSARSWMEPLFAAPAREEVPERTDPKTD